MNKASDLTLFWGIDGGVEVIKLLHEYGADLDARTPKDWTPLSYCRAKGKYGATEEHGIYPEVTTPCCTDPWVASSLHHEESGSLVTSMVHSGGGQPPALTSLSRAEAKV